MKSVCDIFILDMLNDNLLRMSLEENTEKAKKLYNGEIGEEELIAFVEIQTSGHLEKVDFNDDDFGNVVDTSEYNTYILFIDNKTPKICFIPKRFDGRARENPFKELCGEFKEIKNE